LDMTNKLFLFSFCKCSASLHLDLGPVPFRPTWIWIYCSDQGLGLICPNVLKSKQSLFFAPLNLQQFT
jgi:hypothetical protein